MPAIPIISLIPLNRCIFLFAKPSLTALPLTFKQPMGSLLPSNKAAPSSPFNSPEKVNGHKKHDLGFFYSDKRSRGRRAWTNHPPTRDRVPQGGVGRGGVPPPRSLPRLSHHALRGSGYIAQARPQDVTPSFEFSLCDLWQLVRKWSKREGPWAP